MSTELIYEKVRDILSEELGIDKKDITMDSNFIEDLNADSLDIVDLIVQMEHEFDISIPDDEAEQIHSVGDAVNYIAENI